MIKLYPLARTARQRLPSSGGGGTSGGRLGLGGPVGGSLSGPVDTYLRTNCKEME